jgi:hypothetical protein
VSQAVFDKALELLASGAALAANGSSTGVQLNPRFLPTCDWVLCLTGVVATGTYTFNLQISDVVGGTYTTIASFTWPPTIAAGRVNLPIAANQSAFLDSDAKFMRLNYAIGGTTPGAVVESFLAKTANRAGWAYRAGDIITVT